MPFLVAAVVLVGVLCLLNLLLTFGVIRRLKEHTAQLEKVLSGGRDDSLQMLGEQVGEFAATTTDGEPVSRALLAGETVVAFFSPSCAPCREKMPVFVEQARARDFDRQQVLAVVVNESGEPEAAGVKEMAEELATVARVVMEGADHPLANAFKVHAFPAFCVVDAEGVVRVIGGDLDQLLVSAEA
ncbi:TlpA disulfide reductase family protein [Nonomuraea cavernae]|uniref:TlpA family protein n=2 Tax=Nonomuraea cavernae TaxID=2045107 RepID=A0A917Z8T2_9ACTN|nr:TlpA disulfide reductase family protein [Nonomuraea cavernae]GGO78149.1 TlpA family protein [Nonomuraea cavernae]